MGSRVPRRAGRRQTDATAVGTDGAPVPQGRLLPARRGARGAGGALRSFAMAGERMVGIRTVAEALRGEDFPMDRQALAYAVGDIGVEDSRGALVPVRIVLDAM